MFGAESKACLADVESVEPHGNFSNMSPLPLFERVASALSNLHLNKSVGPDLVPSEVVRVGGIFMVRSLL